MAAKEGAARTVVALSTVAEPVAETAGLIAQLERAALKLQSDGNAVGHALASDIAVAAGMLRYKLFAALGGKLSGEVGALVERLHKLL